MRLLNNDLYLPGYDFCLKASHIFNVLDARGAISVSARQDLIKRVRRLAILSARKYLESQGSWRRKMADFIIEIGTEEIPSNMIPALVGELEDKVRARLAEKRIPFEAIKKFGAPRRIGLCIWNIAEKQPDSDETLLGPPASIAMNDNGEWTKAAEGFAKRTASSWKN